jgi:glutathione S-transferase
MKLYTAPGSRGLRVTWTLEEMKLGYEIEPLPMPARKKAPHYLAINPLGTVPALVDGDVIMTESSGIAHYLATRYGPSDLAVSVNEPDYPRFLDFLYHSDATLTFPQTVYIRYCIAEADRGLGEAGRLYVDWFVARLKKIEQRLADREFLCAERFTVADIAVAYPLFLATRIGLADRVPARLRDWLQALMARDGFKRAMAREDEAGRLLRAANA